MTTPGSQPDRPVRFGLVGCGVIAPIHAHCIAELPEAELVALCDILPEKAHQLAEKYPAEVYGDYREMVLRDDIDVVSVLTPSGLHSEVGVAAAQAGKHVIIETMMEVTWEKTDI